MEWLRAEVRSRPLGVDKEKRVIYGAVLAEQGEFKTKGRGEFDDKSIRSIVSLGKSAKAGLKVRFAHPQLSNDGIGKLLGRARDIQQSFVQRNTPEGPKEIALARGDIYFKDHASNTPDGDLAGYVLSVVDEAIRDDTLDDIGMSLVLETEHEYRLDRKGRREVGADGQELPSLWRPTRLHAVDFVDTPDAANSILASSLSITGLPDDVVRQATELLRQQFHGKSREFVAQHLSDWTQRALDAYWPQDEVDEPEGYDIDVLARQLALRRRLLAS